MNSESKIWENLKADYLSQIEKVLASVDNPRTKEILEDVSAHLDRRFAELSLLQQTKENFQKIIFEMGPASDYAELLGETAKKQCSEKVPVRWNEILRKIGINAACSIAVIVIVGLFFLPYQETAVVSDNNSIKENAAVTTQPVLQQEKVIPVNEVNWPVSSWNYKINKLDIDNAKLDDIKNIFGEPEKYIWGQDVLDKDKLPDRYVVAYPGDFHVFMMNGRIREVRFEGPSDYIYGDGLTVGSTVEKALAILGQPAEMVDGKQNDFRENVLYKNIDGRNGWGYYARADKKIRVWLMDNKVIAIYLTRSNFSAGGGRSSSKVELSAGSYIDKRGYIVDKIDFPFVNDADAIGGWESVDFVDDTEDFVSGEKNWGGDLYFKELRFYTRGKTDCAYEWTKGLLLHGGDKTASKYFIKDMNGSKYLFLEWKSGDYTIRHMKPSWYVMVKTDNKSLSAPLMGNTPSSIAGIIIPLGIIQGIIMIAISIPLLTNSIKPNGFYGFRTPKAFSSPEIWYKSNRYGAEELSASGVVMIILSALPALLNLEIFTAVPAIAVFIMVSTVPIVIAIVRSMLYLRKL